MKIVRTKNTEAFDQFLQHFKKKNSAQWMKEWQEQEAKKHGVEEWTKQDEITYTQLRRKHDRIYAKKRRDKTRVREFTHKLATQK